MRREIHPDSAKVRIPPPVALVLTLVMTLVLEWFHSIPVAIPRAAGGVLFIGGISLVLLCAMIFRKNETALPPWQPTTKIVRSGPYQFTRNPIYTGFFLIVLGTSFMLGSLWGVFTCIPLFFFLDRYVIPLEEKYLEGKFGDTYREFKSKVGRWF
jgi:protein-S-isoprenylcysteine O-methyltransferase Ste14